MGRRSFRSWCVVVLGGLSLVACRPTFKPKGELTVAGAAFDPTWCRARSEATGIELADAAGTHLELTLPPQALVAFREIQGAPQVKVTPLHRPSRDLGTCGTLELRGEGYHADGRRAASGKLHLACGGDATGDLEFTGCF